MNQCYHLHEISKWSLMPIDTFTSVCRFTRMLNKNLHVPLSRIYSHNVLIFLYFISIISEIVQQHNLYLKTQQNSAFFRESLQSLRIRQLDNRTLERKTNGVAFILW